MFQTTLKITPGSKTVLFELSKHKDLAKKAIRNSFNKIGKELVNRAKQGIAKPPKTGFIYKYQGQYIQASRVGEYASNRSGRLKNSMNSKTTKDKMVFGTSVEYGKFLEEGHKSINGKWVGKRDNLLKSIVDTRVEQISIIEKMFKRELK